MLVCRVQYLDDSDPFICTNFPEPRRPPTVALEEDVPLSEQVAGIHKLLEAPLKVGHSWSGSGCRVQAYGILDPCRTKNRSDCRSDKKCHVSN